MRRLLALAACLLLLVGCGKGKAAATGGDEADAKQAPVAVETALVTTGPIETTVSAQGTLSPAQGASARVAPVAAGRLVAVPVREGQTVSRGQVVATLDYRPQEAQARSAAAALTASEAQARQAELAARAAATDQRNATHQARLALDAARLDRDAAVQQAKVALSAAQTDLQKTKAGARPQEIAQADQGVRQAQVNRDRAATELERVQFLYEKGIDAKRQLDDAKTALAVADSALASAQQQLSLLRAGARAEDVRAAELRVTAAREALQQAQKSGDAKVAQAQAALQQAEQGTLSVAAQRQAARAAQDTAAQKQADLAAAQATAATSALRAPISGTVTRRLLNPGDMADTTTPVVEIADTRDLNLLANLAAEDGMKVRIGMPVRVTSADAPGQTFSGRVLSVGQVDPQTNLMAVRIAVSNPRGRLRVGAFATADIIVHTDRSAVLLPKQAVVMREGKPVVYTASPDNVAHQTQVAVGAQQGDRVEALQGVRPGDRVITLGQYELADGAKVKDARDNAK